ncbi:glycosyltransferase [Chitinophaga horti]|uniref:Glycosyltransferase n=1 Tax=Chitinophaga horti TaxID=2920382 RepID=A0ABY6JAM9_9BACT|nr:glycosyltransferase family 2 protein [Chitinophaga horti]UYQ95229.1 glycosyltransferase [Chitinophaga horti]
MNTLLQILNDVFIGIQVILAFFVLLPTVLLVIYGIKKLFGWSNSPLKKAADNPNPKQYSFGAIICAHTDLTLVPPLIDSLLKQRYSHFRIYAVADACTPESVAHLRTLFNDPRISVLAPEQAFNNKTKSIDLAIESFTEKHDAFIIFDSDNLVHPDYLSVVNQYFNKGYKVVQTNMLPKNTDTLYARMDASGNLYCNFIDRLMRMELGLSSHIWGLGIVMDVELYKTILYQNFPGTFSKLGGFDKKMQADIVNNVDVLAYATEAIVYDEKIEDGAALQKQRTRWINAYFTSMEYAVKVLLNGLSRFNFNNTFFGINLFRPPLFMMMGAAGLFMIANLFISLPWAIFWFAAIFTFVVTFFSIVVVMSKDSAIFKAMFHLPFFVLRQVKAFLKVTDANKDFLRTNNTKVVYIEEVLNK